MAPSQQDGFLSLPISVIDKIDVGRLMREAQAIDTFLNEAAVRQPGAPMKLPRTSRLLDDTVVLNKLNMLQATDRGRLISFLKEVYTSAPTLHVSFSADPSPMFTQKLTQWLRQELHPLVLLQIGKQPNMGAGCVVRTTNKYFDFSLRNRFAERHDLLIAKLKGAGL